jgi:hypothetical protein
MNSVKVIGIVVLVLGLLGLAYGGFSYTRSTHQAKIGPLELSVKEKETVNIPMWAAGNGRQALIVPGGGLPPRGVSVPGPRACQRLAAEAGASAAGGAALTGVPTRATKPPSAHSA